MHLKLFKNFSFTQIYMFIVGAQVHSTSHPSAGPARFRSVHGMYDFQVIQGAGCSSLVI